MQDVGLGYKPIGSMKKLIKALKSEKTHCIAITKSVFDHHSLDLAKDTVIYDGVFPASVTKREIVLKKGNYFLFVGTLTKSKGVFDAILAFENIVFDYPNIELWIVGNINSIVSEFIENCRSKDRIKLLGFRKDVYQLMSEAKALLVPSYFEGFGFITAEAMMNGCLVIGRDTAGTKEQFDNGCLWIENEIGLRFTNQDELIKHMKYVCQASIDEIMPILSAAKKAAGNYTIENNVEKIERLYRTINYE